MVNSVEATQHKRKREREKKTDFNFYLWFFYSLLFVAQELLNMEKTRTVSLQLDGKKNKKSKPKKKDLANGGGGVSQDGGEGSSANIKEKCHVM